MRLSTLPPRRKPRSVIGRRVSLLRPVVTHGGERFEEGAELLVLGVWKGKLHLVSDDGREILHLRPCYVEGVPQKRAQPPRDRLRLYLRRAPRVHRL